MKNKDPRLAALIRFASAITILNLFGHFLLGFETSFAHPVAALLTGYTLDLAFEKLSATLNHRPPAYAGGVLNFIYFLLPAHISSMAVSMLMFTNENVLPVIFATSMAILSKVIFKVNINGKTRHFLNPSNTGIAISFLLFPWVSTAPPYQFTENITGTWDFLLPVIFISIGSYLNFKLTKKGPLILAWLTGFFLQAVLRSIIFDTTSLAAALLPMSGVAFLLYTFYMISDPATTPVKPKNQILFGLGVSAVYGILTALHIVFGLFFSLIMVCSFRGLYYWIIELLAKYRNKTEEAAFKEAVIPDTVRAFYKGEQFPVSK